MQADTQPQSSQTLHVNEDMGSLEITSPMNVSEHPDDSGTEDTSMADVEEDTHKLALDMQRRCRLLLDELEQFQAYLKEERKEKAVHLGVFKSDVQSEMRFIDKLVKHPPEPESSHALRSSNLIFWDAVWSTAKSCQGIVEMRRQLYCPPGESAQKGQVWILGSEHKRHRQHSTLVDIVCQQGLEWVKVSSIQEKRIIWDLAKSGWVGSDSDEEEGDDDGEPQGLLRQAEALVKAAKATRVKYRNPKVRLVLTRMSSTPETKEVAQMLQQIRDLGVTVQTSDDIQTPPPVADVLEELAPDRCLPMSDVLNIDCTVLLSFASDLSHGQVKPEDWHHKHIARQRALEEKEPLLPSILWPACGARKLVCTREAAIRMQEISSVIGTEAEKRRTALLLDLDENSKLTQEERRVEFEKLSDHAVPTNWSIPIETVDVDVAAVISTLPPAVHKVSELLSEVNRSVFLHGWASGRTTLSSNGVISRQIESTIEKNRASDEDSGPDIWLCSPRSLVGKEKERSGSKKG